MVKLTNFSIVAILLVAIIAIAMKARVTLGDPTAQEILSDAYYETCKSKVGRDCGVMIVSEMFFQNATTDAPCCRKVLTMGKNCHANMLGKILQQSPFKENKGLALDRSRAILARCSSMKN
ncbi:hypothetical protein RHSIM_Rhsim10G0080100 [Rhododendron simsii]|uniref:Prolamin-like domain-containing protein n=1 Tax=Rhododendron simsii TaxID=118357 RepID=A0A834GEU7_RHOSS|nr:hypothetical protein RHSIM_Rhsim10G0080100 [Rhododendron simsii]